jgi:diguanylate cyclase (GGDEF)-like protein
VSEFVECDGTKTKLVYRITGIELFATLLDDDLSYIESRSTTCIYPGGAVIFSAGEKASQFFVVLSGSVAVTACPLDGEQVELARYVAGDTFGDFHFVIGAPYNATARTLENTELLVFPAGGFSFEQMSSEKPDTASRILLRSMTMIASRLRSTDQLISENAPWIRELRQQIFTDPPTGLWNRTFLDSEIPNLLQGPVLVLMLKPDLFKEINDSLGHAAGDAILSRLARVLINRTETPEGGWAVRLRSNEMALIVPGSGKNAAISLAQEIRAEFPSLISPVSGAKDFFLTASMVVGFWPVDHENWQSVINTTNQVLQDLWKSGGNRIVIAGASES